MIVSLNEIEAMARKAARGAGYAWGLAEEAGKAARWLAAHNLPGPDQLAGLLSDDDGASYGEFAPVSVEGIWRAGGDRLCPLVAGAALCDRAGEIAAGCEILLGPTAYPLLLAPYAAAVSKAQGIALELAWTDTQIILMPTGIALEDASDAMTAPRVESGYCKCRTGTATAVSPPGKRAGSVAPETWSRLSSLAHRTYAPATDASRLAGAGAGLTDND